MQAAWTSFHNDKTYVRGFLKDYHVGHLAAADKEVGGRRLLASPLHARTP